MADSIDISSSRSSQSASISSNVDTSSSSGTVVATTTANNLSSELTTSAETASINTGQVSTGGVGPAGPTGATGPAGAIGATGPQGPPGSGLANVEDDTSPSLGGNLDATDHQIDNVTNIYVDYIGGNTDANVPLDINADILGTLKQGGVTVPTISSTNTLTNKTLTSPVITTPTGIVKGDVGLGNVDNTSDATKNAASVTLTNKTISGSNNTITNIAESSVTNLVSDLAAKEATANKGIAGGYAELTSSGAVPPSRTASHVDNTLPLRVWRAALARRATTPVVAVVLGDSITAGIFPAANLENTRWTAQWEGMLAEKYNTRARASGWVQIDTPAAFPYPQTIHWDTNTGSVASPQTGVDKHAYSYTSTQYAEITRTMDGFILYYTAQRTGGASFEVRLDGVLIDTFSTTDGTVAASPGYSSGRSKSYSATTYGSHIVKVTATGAGTAILEAGYFCAGNRTTGVKVHNGGQGGKEINDFLIANNPAPNQHLVNQQPQLVVIMAGVNDYYHGVMTTPGQYTTRLTNLVAEIRTAVTNVSILIVHEQQVDLVASTWATTFRDAARELCISDGNIAFVDVYETLGAYGSGNDPLLFAPSDGIHQETAASYLIAQAVFAATGMTPPASTLSGKIGGSTGSTDNKVLRADGTDTLTVQNSNMVIDDSGNVTGVNNLTATGGSINLTDGTAGDGAVKNLVNTVLGAGAAASSIYKDSGDAQAVAVIGQLGGAGYFSLGAGGSSTPDVVITRSGANAASINSSIAMNSHKITGLTNGSSAQDAAAFGQIPVVGVDVQAYDADLGTLAGLTATTDNFIQSKSSAWASRTPAQVTADLSNFTSSSKGLVPTPTSATGKLLLDSGAWTGNMLFTESGAVLNISDGTASHGALRTSVSAGLGLGASTYQVFIDTGDTQPAVNFGWIGGVGPFVGFGAGGSSAIDTTISRNGAGSLTMGNNKFQARQVRRVTTITSSATPTVNTDNCDAVTITAQAAAITSMTSGLTGTPLNFDRLVYRIKDNGTARAITWGASFEPRGVALPTTTVISKLLRVEFEYDTVTSKWGCISSLQEA